MQTSPAYTTTDSNQTAPLNPEVNIGKLADQCVKCGLCLPHCPTYRLLHNEADSPRGRIALMQGLEHGDLDADATLLRHLDRCLACRACEKSCPSGVQYSRLLDTTRARLQQHGTRRPLFYRLLRRLGLYLAAHPAAWRRAWLTVRGYQRSGLQTLLRGSGILRLFGVAALEAQLPVVHGAPARGDKTTLPDTGRPCVGLLRGCMEDVVSATLIDDTRTILTALGWQAIIPEGQGCCGALHQHNGAVGIADTLGQRNRTAFSTRQIDTALYLSSGCGATLCQTRSDSTADETTDKQPQFIEAVQFIAAQMQLTELSLAPLPETVVLFTPCSQRHVTGGDSATRELLERIPGIDLQLLAGDCCGAAGTYMLSQADIAQRLRSDVLDGLTTITTRYLVTANVGCALHLGNGLRQRNPGIEIIHPLTLLRRQLRSGPPGQ